MTYPVLKTYRFIVYAVLFKLYDIGIVAKTVVIIIVLYLDIKVMDGN